MHTFNHLEISKSTELFLKIPLTFLHLENVSDASVRGRAAGCRGTLMMSLVLTFNYATNDGGRSSSLSSSSPVLCWRQLAVVAAWMTATPIFANDTVAAALRT